MNIRKGTERAIIPGILIVTGAFLFIVNILFYPLVLPTTITSTNSEWIQSSVYLFYLLYSLCLLSITIGTIMIIRNTACNNNPNLQNEFKRFRSTHFSFLPTSISEVLPESRLDNKVNYDSIYSIFFDILYNKTSLSLFILTFFIYGLFYSIISGTFIIRPEGGMSHMYAIESFPYMIMMQYGPIGYIPSISIYLNDFLGIYIVPITLTVIIAISVLVGFNVAASIYAFRLYRLENNAKRIQTKERTKFISVIGTVTGLFAACPSCASLYLFNVFAGSLSTTVASFAATYYILFLLISFPLLIITPFIIVSNIKKIKMGKGNECHLDSNR